MQQILIDDFSSALDCTTILAEVLGLLGRRDNQASVLAFEMLYEHYQEPIKRYFARRGYDTEHAADLCQVTFMRVWKYFIRLETTLPQTADHIRNLLYKIASDVATDDYRRNNHFDIQPLLNIDTELSIEGHEERLIERIQLYELLAELPPQQRESLYRRYILGDSEKEVAADLASNPKSVSSNASRGKEQLHKKIYQVNVDIRVMEAKTAIRQSGLMWVPLITDDPSRPPRSQPTAQSLLEADDREFKRIAFTERQIFWPIVKEAIENPARFMQTSPPSFIEHFVYFHEYERYSTK
jgi:RNA polymerase sigma factor (sigma-70 family)